MNSAACRLRAMRTRSPSGTKVSSVRVITTRYLPVFSSWSRSSSAKSSTIAFSISPLARHGAVVDAAMAGIEHDDRPRIAWSRRLALAVARRRGCAAARLSSASARMKASRSVAARSSTSRAGWPSRGIEHEGLVDPHRLGQVEHDARAALHDQAEAERLDQAAAGLAGLGRQLEGHLRHVDDHAIGIGEREGAQIDLAARNRRRSGSGCRRRRPGRRSRPESRAAAGAAAPAARPRRRLPRPPSSSASDQDMPRSVARIAIESRALRAPSYSIRRAWLIGT